MRVLRDRYELQSVLGRGRSGTVYRAVDRRRTHLSESARCVAVKVLNGDYADEPAALAELERQFHQAQSLAHPNIVSVFDLDRDGRHLVHRHGGAARSVVDADSAQAHGNPDAARARVRHRERRRCGACACPSARCDPCRSEAERDHDHGERRDARPRFRFRPPARVRSAYGLSYARNAGAVACIRQRRTHQWFGAGCERRRLQSRLHRLRVVVRTASVRRAIGVACPNASAETSARTRADAEAMADFASCAAVDAR